MTRINTLHPKYLSDQHLMAEYRELPRVFTIVKKGKDKGKPGTEFKMGEGHVKFFYDKLDWLFTRYYDICTELMNRKYKINMIKPDDLWTVGNRSKHWSGNWKPTLKDHKVSCERLLHKLNTQNHTYHKCEVGILKNYYKQILESKDTV